MTLQRRRIHWSGFPGGPGINTFFLQEGATANAAFHAFYLALQSYLINTCTISFDTAGDEVDEATGALTGTWTDSSAAAITGTAAGNYAGGSGAVVEWLTADVAVHRRIVGKTFIVPLANAAFQSDGTLAAAFVTAALNAANTMVATLVTPNQLKVWHRPVHSAGGRAVDVTGARVPDLAAVLRSRRD